ncbi:MAG: Fic family protein [Rickettsiaceae bacterium]|jgi:Fic family protein|nr:Fic family protein [Rickettsiaceae bacterium]
MEKILKLESPGHYNDDDLIKEFLNIRKLLSQEDMDIAADAAVKTISPKYLYWSEFKNKQWFPKKLSQKQIWGLVKLTRQMQGTISSPIKAEDNQFFAWHKLRHYDEMLHYIDLELGGNLMGISNISKEDKHEFISRGILEEAIASSQMEGAHTTRQAAKKLIREGRKPRNYSERMIVNNYKAMKEIETNYKNHPLSRKLLAEIHSVITEGTLDEGSSPGVFRKDEDNIVITDPNNQNIITHITPKIAFVEEEIDKLIQFANNELDVGYIHPLIKAIMLHFWIGYLHPYVDGNGRLARTLFYWYILRQGYWAFAYLPISTIIKKSKVQYCKAYIYSEQDDYDLTYFIDYNLRKIQEAKNEFNQFLTAQKEKNASMSKLAHTEYNFNDRQIKLLQHFHGNKDDRTNATMYMNIYDVTKPTAINDLKSLEKNGLLFSKRQGNNIYYYPTDKLTELFTK